MLANLITTASTVTGINQGQFPGFEGPPTVQQPLQQIPGNNQGRFPGLKGLQLSNNRFNMFNRYPETTRGSFRGLHGGPATVQQMVPQMPSQLPTQITANPGCSGTSLTPVPRGHFTKILKNILAIFNYDTQVYLSHSFRIGDATLSLKFRHVNLDHSASRQVALGCVLEIYSLN